MTVNQTAPERSGSATVVRGRSGVALTAMGLAALLAVMDGTVVAVALEPLATAFSTSLSAVVWMTIAYLLAAATTLPLLAWATARFGGRAVFLTGLGLFLVGSLLCAVAPSAAWLIAFRVVQGLGGGLLEPSALALAARMADQRTVGRVLGIMSMVINIAPVVGPLVGAALASSGNWRWIFLLNIPLGLVVLVAALIVLPPDRTRSTEPKPPADLRGLSMLTVGYVAVLFALNRSGQEASGWPIAVAGTVGLLLLAGYTRHALSATAAPALDLRLLKQPGFAACLAVMSFVGFIMYAQLAALPILGADRYHLTGVAQGLLVCALGAGLLVSMSIGGRVSDRTGPRPLVLAGGVGTAVLFAITAAAHDTLPLPATVVLFALIGLGFGATASPTFASVYRILPPAHQPAGTVALFMSVQLTASLGVTVLGLIHASAAWPTTLFLALSASAIAIALLSRSLPGRPAEPHAPRG